MSRTIPYTTKEAAHELRDRGYPIDQRTLAHLCDGGELRSVRLTPKGPRRIPASAFEAYWSQLVADGRAASGERMFTTGKAAEYLAEHGLPTSRMTIWRWCESGVLRSVPSVGGRQRLIPRVVLDDFIEKML